jgi:hypothetical protein
MIKEVTCLNCGWVNMAVPPEAFRDWGDEPRYGCFNCGKTEFRDSELGDCPVGVTIQAVAYPHPVDSGE